MAARGYPAIKIDSRRVGFAVEAPLFDGALEWIGEHAHVTYAVVLGRQELDLVAAHGLDETKAVFFSHEQKPRPVIDTRIMKHQVGLPVAVHVGLAEESGPGVDVAEVTRVRLHALEILDRKRLTMSDARERFVALFEFV